MPLLVSVWQVNYFSVVAMCKAFMPLIKKNKGSRIVNVVSMAGRQVASQAYEDSI